MTDRPRPNTLAAARTASTCAAVRGPQRAHLSGTMTGRVVNGQPAGDGRHLAVVQRVIDRTLKVLKTPVRIANRSEIHAC